MSLTQSPERQEFRIVDHVTDDGDGDVTVWLDNDAWMTVRQGDLPIMPSPGDRVIVQLPRIVSIDRRR